jgi:predicted house-cleaning noncanonical NTP pyrophosphatase (MazG superfamily)
MTELLNRLIEEAIEQQDSPNLEERADIEQVLREIDVSFGFSQDDIKAARLQKEVDRGDFSEGIFLESMRKV